MRLRNKLVTAGCVAASAAMLLTGVSCNDHEIAPFSQSLSAGQRQSLSSGSTRPVDILFVVDNSNSMMEEQRGLDENFSKFLDQLSLAGADYRLGAVNTSYAELSPFQVLAPWSSDNDSSVKAALNNISDAGLAELRTKCENYFGESRLWISSSDRVLEDGTVDPSGTPIGENVSLLKELFRCESIGGTKGHAIERGLGTMRYALEYDTNVGRFKRDGSILAIVFVTDENDCTENGDDLLSYGTTGASVQSEKCETKRNIEDSCTIPKYDQIVKIEDRASHQLVSSLQTAGGQLVSIGAETTVDGYEIGSHTLRELCVAGDDAARAILTKCIESENCSVKQYIDCPEGGCANTLAPRKDFYDAIINMVATSNKAEYEKNKSLYDNATSEDEKKAIRNELARKDVIVANIINRDEGKRFSETLNEKWCGGSGSQSYRYQLFAEMFDNDPIYAPICCRKGKKSHYVASYKEVETLATVVGDVCSADVEEDTNGQFGPVLGAIGQRIGEAVNTVCADSAPVTCNPSDCNGEGGPNANCPCNFGCNESAYFSGTDRAYHLCNEFKLNVGVVPSDLTNPDDIANQYTSYTAGNEYSVNYESDYCLTRTNSPIQINLNKNQPNTSLIIEYPKKVSGI